MLLAVLSCVYDVTSSVHDVSNRISFTQMLIRKDLEVLNRIPPLAATAASTA
jgi:hypothetical protein